MVVMVGLPGAGKSVFAHRLQRLALLDQKQCAWTIVCQVAHTHTHAHTSGLWCIHTFYSRVGAVVYVYQCSYGANEHKNESLQLVIVLMCACRTYWAPDKSAWQLLEQPLVMAGACMYPFVLGLSLIRRGSHSSPPAWHDTEMSSLTESMEVGLRELIGCSGLRRVESNLGIRNAQSAACPFIILVVENFLLCTVRQACRYVAVVLHSMKDKNQVTRFKHLFP